MRDVGCIATTEAHPAAALAFDDEPRRQCAGDDFQIGSIFYRIEITVRGANTFAIGNRRLAHRDAFLRDAVVVPYMGYAGFLGRRDERLKQWIPAIRIGHLQRTAAPPEFIAAAGV